MDRKRKINESPNHEDPQSDQPHAGLAEKRPRTFGPALPPSLEGGHDKSASESDSDSDDDFGPSLPPAGGRPQAADNTEDHSKSKGLPEEEATKSPGPKTGQRDSWMLQPPDSSDWSSRVDPTKLRSRGFQTGRSARGQGAGKQIDGSWTETPQEKMHRLQDQVMGVAAPTPSGGQETAAEESRKAEMMRERIQKYNKETRESSQSDSSRTPKKDKEDDDPSKRPFDREKDMSLSSRISNAQRREMVNKASDYGSRFSGGKFL